MGIVRHPLHQRGKGPFKPYRYMVVGEDRGVPFRRRYRTERGARKLTLKQGITNASIVTL